ncbi:MAG: hypothetical protein K2W96_25155 [Gemmataceae bacterium]|nr:hypothetical protein [Gemmataceae bacterium]
MALPAELATRIRELDWVGLAALWGEIRSGKPVGWEEGEALEYLVIRAFELDPDEMAALRYPYEVELFGQKVEEIDGAVHLPGLSCIVESKDWGSNVPIGPIAKMRNQLLRRPAGTVGLLFAKQEFTEPAICLAYFAMPQAILLWSGSDLDVVLRERRICRFLRRKHRSCCEDGTPEYDLREEPLR